MAIRAPDGANNEWLLLESVSYQILLTFFSHINSKVVFDELPFVGLESN